jgi:hypothetical protein
MEVHKEATAARAAGRQQPEKVNRTIVLPFRQGISHNPHSQPLLQLFKPRRPFAVSPVESPWRRRAGEFRSLAKEL